MMGSLENNPSDDIWASSWLCDSYPPSTTPIRELKRICLKDLSIDSHHRGCYVLVQINPSLPFSGGVAVVGDQGGHFACVRIVHQDGKRTYNESWGQAKFLIFKEPFYVAITRGSMGYITVHHITDVIVVSLNDSSLPKNWQMRSDKSVDEWKQVGNKAVSEKQYHLGIDCYNRALVKARHQDDILTIRLNRCQARLFIQCFDHAVADANVVLNRFPRKEKALFRKAEALYQLRRFKEAKEVLGHMISLYPRNEIATQRMERVARRLQEEAGIYDFAGMLKENMQPMKLDRANYIGSVEVRTCKDKSRGRGLFLTKPVYAGELLLCEKAFSVSLLSIHDDDDNDDGLSGNGLDVARHDLDKDCVFQFHRNPSLLPAFKCLHSGRYSPEKIAEIDGQVVLDGFMIRAIIDMNCYKFFQSRDFHRRFARAEPDLLDQDKSAGIWINASYINHSCLPNIETAFIGDMMIIRAAKDLDAGSELTYSYTGLLGSYEERQSGLKDYGFQCTCARCLSDKKLRPDCRDVRAQILNSLELENRKLAMSKGGTTLGRLEKLLDDFDSTYTTPASNIPRPEIYMELFISIRNLDSWEMFSEVVTLVFRLLVVSGFDLRIGKNRFRVMQWGSVSDLTVTSLAYMWKAYGTVNPALCHEVEEVLKTAYEIVVGERWSFEGVYGELRAIYNLGKRYESSETKASVAELF